MEDILYWGMRMCASMRAQKRNNVGEPYSGTNPGSLHQYHHQHFIRGVMHKKTVGVYQRPNAAGSPRRSGHISHIRPSGIVALAVFQRYTSKNNRRIEHEHEHASDESQSCGHWRELEWQWEDNIGRRNIFSRHLGLDDKDRLWQNDQNHSFILATPVKDDVKGASSYTV